LRELRRKIGFVWEVLFKNCNVYYHKQRGPGQIAVLRKKRKAAQLEEHDTTHVFGLLDGEKVFLLLLLLCVSRLTSPPLPPLPPSSECPTIQRSYKDTTEEHNAFIARGLPVQTKEACPYPLKNNLGGT
jgi:hypothetical protein